MKVFLNGNFMEEQEALISPFDRGFMFSDGVFETIRVYNCMPFAWKAHLRRLMAGLRLLKIKIPYTSDKLLFYVQKLLEYNKLTKKDAYLRITVTRGVTTGLKDFSCNQPTVFMFVRELNLTEITEKRQKGITASLVPFSRGDLSHIKHLGYFESLIALLNADASHGEAVFTNNGKVLEGATSNIFFVKSDNVVTPHRNILKGIMRKEVISILREAGFKIEERDVRVAELNTFQGAFITNSIIEVVPLKQIDNIHFNVKAVAKLIELIREDIKKSCPR